MVKMNCDIMKDLIPSYVDEVCSEATKRCVEEHIMGCDRCRQMVSLCRDNALSGQKLEQRGFDGLKKIKDVMKLQRLVCYLVLVFMVYTGVQTFLFNHNNYVLFSQPTLLLFICILATQLSSIGYKGKNAPGKPEYLLGAISFCLSLYLILITLYFGMQMRPEMETIFGMEPHKAGPFLDWQFLICFLVQLAFFVYHLWRIIKQEKNCSWLLCLNMMGIFLTVAYDSLLKNMETFEVVRSMAIRDTLEITAIGILGVVASLLAAKKGDRGKKENG